MTDETRPTSTGRKQFHFSSIAVIESLGPDDLKTGRQLYDDVLLPASQKPGGPTAHYWFATSKSDLSQILTDVKRTAIAEGRCPIVHIEAHGGVDGLRLASDERYGWQDLKPRLAEINRISRLNLLVVIAACSGAHICQILVPGDAAPAFAVLGPRDVIPSGDIQMDFPRFYSYLLTCKDGRVALSELNGTGDQSRWRYETTTAESMFKVALGAYGKQSDRADLRRRAKAIGRNLGSSPPFDRSMRHEFTAQALSMLSNPSAAREAIYRQFFMVDEFPENLDRFPFNEILRQVQSELADFDPAPAKSAQR